MLYKSGLLGTDIEFRHQPPILFDIFLKQLCGLFYAGGDRLECLLFQVFPDCRHGQHFVDLNIETDDDCFLRSGRCECPDPLIEHQPVEARFQECRNVR